VPKSIPVVYEGVTYKSFASFCRNYGLAQAVAYHRYYYDNWSLRECISGKHPFYHYKVCRYCYSMFIPNSSIQVYCGVECRVLYGKRFRGKCEWCGGNVFAEKWGRHKFCSTSCASKHAAKKRGKWARRIKLRCTYCGKPFERLENQVGTHQKLFFCSSGCSEAYFKSKRGNKKGARNKGLKSDLRFSILMRDDFKCRYCGASASDGVKLEVDHIVARCHGGGNDESNLITSCARCNQGKGAKQLPIHQRLTIIPMAETISDDIWDAVEKFRNRCIENACNN